MLVSRAHRDVRPVRDAVELLAHLAAAAGPVLDGHDDGQRT